MRIPDLVDDAARRKLVLVALFVVVAFVLITYSPSFRIGFFGDDWWQVANAGRKSLPDFLRFYFDPTVQTIWYRPAHGLLLLAEYTLFGSNAEGYHWVYNAVHLLNCVLLFAILYQITNRWRLAFVASLLFAGFFPGSVAVFGIAVHDPLAALFYLATIWLWFHHLRTRRRLYFWLAIGSCVLALLSKETSVSLILTLFLVDRIFVAEKLELRLLLRRYGLMAFLLLGYLAIEYRVQLQGHFSNQAGYGFGLQLLDNLQHYVALLLWPWRGTWPLIGIAFALLFLIGIVLRKQDWGLNYTVLCFLGLELFLAIAPVLGFPTSLFETRYLYFASIVPAVLIAVLFEWTWKSIRNLRPALFLVSFSIVLLAFMHSSSTMGAAADLAELNRQARVPFRDIVQQHPSFPPDTLLYFINPPQYVLRHVAPSAFFLHYGKNVTVWSVDPQWYGTIDEDRVAGLRDHKNSFVYYYDDTGQRHEVPVNLSSSPGSTPRVPVDFGSQIELIGYEVTSTTLKHGESLLLLLYWKAKAPIDRDYTIFTHLVGADGRTAGGQDSQPQNGAAPTSKWKAGKLVVDPHILPITDKIPTDKGYRLEVGLYYLPTLERVGIVDNDGRAITDTLTIQSFDIVGQ